MKFKIFRYNQGPKGVIYTLWKEGDELPELENALLEYKEIRGERYFYELIAFIRGMCEKTGFRVERFRDENLTWKDGIYALRGTAENRFYLYHNSSERIILTGGGVKTTKLFQEDPKLLFVVNCLKSVSKLLWDYPELNLKLLSDSEIDLDFTWSGELSNVDEILEKITNGS